jgi:threonine aldolase
VTLVNLYSDTQTRPTAAMRAAMAAAECGDEQRFEDPTVNALCDRVAELLGFEAAVFLPSGTMCNAIGMQVHVRGGEQVILHRLAHPLIAEGGGPAALSSAFLTPLDGERGMFTAEQVRAALHAPGNRYAPRSRLICVEQTTNIAGGRVWPLAQLRAVLDVAREAGLRTHLDGARLLNAVVAAGVPATEWTRGFDTAWIDFTKGLGAPLGACLAASRELIDEAWRYKQMMGGAMRQAGIVAAGALHALEQHVERLAEDHANARALAGGLARLEGVTVDPAAVETNIVVFSVADAPAFCAALERAGVLMGSLDATTVRAVTHLDVSAEGVERAVVEAARVLD